MEDKSVMRPPGLGTRHFQVFMTFLCLTFAYSMRSNLSVAVVAMTTASSSHPEYTVLQWSTAQQGVISGAFFWGYIVSGIPAGHITRTLGPKYPLGIAMVVCSLVTMLSPWIALNCSWVVFCFTRVVEGLAQGFCYPSVNTHMAKWAPPMERSRIFGFVFGGTQLGILLTMAVSGYLADSSWGWPSIFYCTGLCGLLWGVAWMFVGADSPDSHSYISDTERLYIKSSQPHNSDHSKTMATPWRGIITSLPMWAILSAHVGQNWGYWMLVTMMPTYLSHVLNFNLTNNGLLSTLPYLCLYILTLVVSWADDFIKRRHLLPLSVTRKMWNTIAHWGGAAALVGVSFTTSSPAVVTLLTVSVALNAGTFVGFLCNHHDLAPNFAGLLLGITNAIGNITAVLGPTITGVIVSDQTSRDQWMVAFYISAAIFFVGNLIFVVLGSTDVQPWNEPKATEKSPT